MLGVFQSYIHVCAVVYIFLNLWMNKYPYCRWMMVSCSNSLAPRHTLVQVMACCHQATSHYLSQWWPCVVWLIAWKLQAITWFNVYLSSMMSCSIRLIVIYRRWLKHHLFKKGALEISRTSARGKLVGNKVKTMHVAKVFGYLTEGNYA